MANIKIILKDGTEHNFRHEGRTGGSYTKRLKLEGSFAVVEDEWGKQTIFPSADVAKIESSPERY